MKDLGFGSGLGAGASTEFAASRVRDSGRRERSALSVSTNPPSNMSRSDPPSPPPNPPPSPSRMLELSDENR